MNKLPLYREQNISISSDWSNVSDDEEEQLFIAAEEDRADANNIMSSSIKNCNLQQNQELKTNNQILFLNRHY